MHRTLVTLTLTALVMNASAQSLPDSLTLKMNKVVEDFKNKYHIPGLAVAFVKDHDIVYSQGLGYTDLDRKTPVTIDSRFPIMSISKTFTATLLVQMAEKEIVGLHDKITKYVPEYKVKTADGRPATTTLYQLASHTAGLPRNSPADIGLTESYDRYLLLKGKSVLKWPSTDQELLQSLPAIKLDYLPYDFVSENSRHYSNLGYSVLGIALKRAAKTSFETYLMQHLCRPLQMTNTGFLTEPGIYDKVAKGYRYVKSSSSYDLFPDVVPNSALYCGSMYSTARDLCRYLSFHMDNSHPQHDKVLSAEGKAMMRSQRIGWKALFPYAMHEGSLPGYRSMVVFNPVDKFGWVILTNAGDVDFNPLNNAFAEIIGTAFKRKVNTSIEQYAGIYILPQQLGSITITVKNDSLYSTYQQDLLGNKPLTRAHGHLFSINGANEHSIGYDFMADEQGRIKALRLGQLTWYKQAP